jgi:hypothetical protein
LIHLGFCKDGSTQIFDLVVVGDKLPQAEFEVLTLYVCSFGASTVHEQASAELNGRRGVELPEKIWVPSSFLVRRCKVARKHL